jgi:hypothetical protein
LLGVKVWISTVPNFDFTTIQPLEFAPGSGVAINDLEVNTQYYLRYAFISKIDPETFTVSQQLTARTYDEATRVYGELTNDPIYLSRQIGFTEIDWAPVNGVFRVVDLNTEVTGANDPVKGPVYSIVTNSITNGIQATINSVTGEFSATSWSGVSRTGKVTFKAVYDGIEVLRDWNLVDGIGQDAAQLTLTLSPDNFIYKDVTAVLSSVPQVTAVASLTNITGTPQFTVTGYSENGTVLGTVPFTQNNNSITVTNQQFHINNNISYAVVRAQLGTVFDEDTIKRLNNGTDAITVDVSNPVVQLQADESGLVDSAEYSETGTEIEVYQGSVRIPVSTTLATAPSWRIINVTGTGITPDPTELISQFSIVYDRHDEMLLDTASIEYTIEYKTSAGFIGTRVVKQSFSKSKQGVTGASAPLVVLRAERLAFVKFANSQTVAPEFIDIVAQVSNIVNPVYLWRENGVVVSGQTANTLRVNKFSNTGNKTFTVEVSGISLTGEAISRTTSFTLYYIQEGSDAISSMAVPQQNTISCDSNGIPDPAQFPIIIDTIAVRGAEILPNNTSSYVLQDIDGVTVSAVPGQPGKFQITGVSEYYGSFVIAMTAGGVTFYHPVYTTKVVDGNSAPVINLTANNQIFVKRKDGSYSMSQTTITATSQNVTGNYAWYVDDVLQTGQTAATFSVAQFAATASKVVKCERGGVFDVMTIYSIEEGSDAVTVGLTNESQSLAYDESGNLHPGQDINSQMIAVKGGELLAAPAVSYSLVSTTNGLVAAIGSNTGAITVTEPATAGSNKQFLAVFRATIAATGTTFDKTLSINVTKDGATGRRTAELKVFQWSDTTPPTPPSGTSTYTWNGGTYTLPSTPGNWSLTAPASSPGQKLYQATIRYSDILTTSSTTVSWTGAIVSEAGAAGAAGLPGAKGTNTATIALYAKNTSSSTAPSAFSGPFTYTFSSASLTGGTLNGWSTTAPGITKGEYLWVRYAVAASNLLEDEVLTTDFSAAVISSVGGIDGARGTNTATIALYAKNTSSTTPPSAFSGPFTYTFSNASLTGGNLNGWSRNAPGITNGEYLWARYAVAASNLLEDEVLDTDFSAAVVNGVGGINGLPGAASTVPGPTGLQGITTRIVYYKVLQTATGITPPGTPANTTGEGTIPTPSVPSAINGWSSTSPTVSVGETIFYSYGRYNPNPSTTVDGIAANTTVWSVPIAASVFQDIRSDNWNGSNPPTAATPSTWGTQGYYIDRTNGNMYASAFYARGNSMFRSSTKFEGSTSTDFALTTSVSVNTEGNSDIGILGTTGTTSGFFGVYGLLKNPSGSAGIQGVSTFTNKPGIVARNNQVSGVALELNGNLSWKDYQGIGSVVIPVPDGSTTKYLRADGTWSTIAAGGTGTVTSVGGTGTVSGLTLSGTVTSSGNLTLGGTLSVSPSNFTSQIANTVLAAPNGASGTPTFRALVVADIPTLNQNTTGTAANVTGTVAIANGGTGVTTAAAALTALGAYAASNPSGYTTNTGTVTSVGGTGTVSGLTLSGTVTSSGSLTLGGTLSASASAITSGTIATARLGSGTAGASTALMGDQTYKTVVYGVFTSGLVTGPGFLNIVGGSGISVTRSGPLSDAAGCTVTITSTATGTVTSVGGTGTVSGLTLSGTVTSSGNLTLGGTLSAPASAITSGTIATARLGSGTASSSNYLRGDGAWAAITATSAQSINASGVVTISGGGSTTIENTLASLPGSKWFCGPDSSGNFLVYNNNSVGMFMSSGNTSWSAGSDETLKNQVALLEDNARARIKGLIPRYFTFKEDSNNKVYTGYFAQNVQEFIPDAVVLMPPLPGDTQPLLGVTADVINVHLVKAVQELTDENEILKQMLESITARLTLLETKSL